MAQQEFAHEPVLADKVIELLAPDRGGTFLDGTLGGGGQLLRERGSWVWIRILMR